ncbi:resuscitation-promoting factor [Nocardioides insulae]|uniref:resuscitation-promoting factor n=1 Tax=Nocardioides insulae TaxID=394734 RepID=UPI00068469A7|nr:resuscitation-promoting factor [Nocardioides insulae]
MSMRSVTRAVRGGACVVLAGAVLAGIGVGPADAAPVASSAGKAGSAAAPKTVLLKVGGKPVRREATRAGFATGLLAQEHIGLDHNDSVQIFRGGREVTSAKHKALRSGDRVKVNVVTVRVRTHRNRVKPRTVIRKVSSLPAGKRKVVDRGRAGVRQARVRLEWRNGHRVDRDVRKRWVRKPHARVVHVGRKAGSVPGTNNLNWGALARCESGGNPRAVNSAGYYGLYQFSVGTWHSVGGKGMPHNASRGEQTYRAKKLYASRGRSPWPNCGRLL